LVLLLLCGEVGAAAVVFGCSMAGWWQPSQFFQGLQEEPAIGIQCCAAAAVDVVLPQELGGDPPGAADLSGRDWGGARARPGLGMHDRDRSEDADLAMSSTSVLRCRQYIIISSSVD
jgi:hypothetical protein